MCVPILEGLSGGGDLTSSVWIQRAEFGTLTEIPIRLILSP